MTNLYLYEPSPGEEVSEKTAAEAVLPDDQNAWSHEILQEFYKQVPYAADYEPSTVMDRVDGERGYAFGHIEIQNKSEVQSDTSEQARAAAGIHTVRIPIIVKNKKLQPLDILVTEQSKVLPLTEQRLRETLFRPSAFDVTGRTPGDISMAGQIFPPYRQNAGMGSGGSSIGAGMGKESSQLERYLVSEKLASDKAELQERISKALGVPKDKLGKHPAPAPVKTAGVPSANVQKLPAVSIKSSVPKLASVLEAILPTAYAEDLETFTQKIAEPSTRAAYTKYAASTLGSVQKIWNSKQGLSEKVAQAFDSSLPPSVVQITKESTGYGVKQASAGFWQPEVYHGVSRGEIIRQYGVKIAMDADMSGSVTIPEEGGVKDEGMESGFQPITEFGLYKVEDNEGKELLGTVFPNLVDLDGTVLPMALFTNGSAVAVQSDIAGQRQGEAPTMLYSDPTGEGVFVREGPDGPEATIPLTLKGKLSDGEEKMQVETYDGRTCMVSLQPNIPKPTMVEEGMYLIPEDFQWMSLGSGESVSLVGAPGEEHKQASLRNKLAQVTVRSDGAGSFSFEGFAVDKLASGEKNVLSLDDSLFLLGALGTDLEYGGRKLAQAMAVSAPVDIRIGRYLRPAEDVKTASRLEAAKKLEGFPDLRQDLVKAAAFMPDPTTVDTILSLGFINPENIRTFVSYLPEIDAVQSKMCELLLSGRLGLTNIPVGPLEKSIRCTEDVITGLKTLAFQQA